MRRILIAFIAAVGIGSTAPVLAQVCPPFTDVAADDPFCANIQWMHNRGVTLGCETNAYCPTQFVRRDQMAAFMNRLGNIVFQQGGNAFGVPAILGTTDFQPVEIASGNSRIRLGSDFNVVAGYQGNTGNVFGSVIAGGGNAGNCSTAAEPNRPCRNEVTGSYSSIGGGWANIATGSFAVVAGGSQNTVSGNYSFAAGGRENVASAAYTFAAGRRARASTEGSFIWADSRNFDFMPSVPNFFGVRATGGAGITVAIDPTTGAVTQFCNLLPGVPFWQCTSDRDTKENFEPVDSGQILERLAAMPLMTWNFKGADPSIRNIGPTAQDFKAAFGLGTDDKSIASGNLHGVALAAIQGLNAKLEAKIAEQAREIAALRRALDDVLARLDRSTDSK